MVIPELGGATNEIIAPTALKTVVIKRRAPRRSPNIRKLVAGLAKLGEFEEQSRMRRPPES
eukprot:5217312-Pyramimonas_sp.AAC.1